MIDNVKIEFIPKGQQMSEYDWANIIVGNERVGKARCRVGDDQLIIYSINIFPEFQGLGYGTFFIDAAKLKYNKIIADRVRQTAIGFWEKIGFIPDNEGNWFFQK